MTDALEERFLRVYCPTHKTTFAAAGGRIILCESGGEALSTDFPYDLSWEYCCVCRTYSPVDMLRGSKGRMECPVCNRRVVQRYLCDKCNLLSLEPDAPSHLKRFTLLPNGSQPPRCPGCLTGVNPSLQHHDCTDVEMEFFTARYTCPFCEEVIVEDERQGALAKKVSSTPSASLPSPKRNPSGQPPTQIVATQTRHREVPASGAPSSRPLVEQALPTWTRQLPPTDTPAPGKRSKKLIIAGAVVAVAVILYTAIVIRKMNTSALQEPAATKPAPSTVPPGMVAVLGGDFMMGRDDGDEYERPQHRVNVSPYYIDVYETTCEQYADFIRATGHSPPVTWKNSQYPQGAERRPVTGVNWDDATAYAKWAGKRLPSEEEWEFAARGNTGFRYPWGNAWKPGAANADNASTGGLAEVGRYEGTSPFGVFDMIGNAWEWTASDLKAYPGGQLPTKLLGDTKVIRGGSWKEGKEATTTYR
ncbi:MAG: gamma-glutamyl hercynylcysteine S-oxide synthase, partial [Acidobacteriota bacterium]|nr:gamma-glutamyl hercynylcysteine S-oxide synthase [Acidobacteriota bacterium]